MVSPETQQLAGLACGGTILNFFGEHPTPRIQKGRRQVPVHPLLVVPQRQETIRRRPNHRPTAPAGASCRLHLCTR